MPLVRYSLETIKTLLDKLHKGRQPGTRLHVLGFSNPDVIATPAELLRIFGERVRPAAIRPDSEQIVHWHKAHHITSEVVDTVSLFEKLGATFEALDRAEGRGNEMLLDLSEPIPRHMHNGYDLVVDIISNQVFNVAQCMASAALACKPGGYVFHVIPVNMVNQGYWNVCPVAYWDFYEANGFTVHQVRHEVGVLEAKQLIHLESERRCRNVPDDTINVVVVQKQRDMEEKVVWPIMRKFHRHPTSKLAYDQTR
jgi:hypothetical protein